MTYRLPDWRERLTAFIEEARSSQFERGVYDCITFGSGIAVAITGIDPFPEAKGGYGTIREGVELMKSCGYASLAEGLADRLQRCGAVPIPLKFANLGDFVLVRADDGHGALGMCWTEGVLTFLRTGPAISTAPLAAWRIV